MVEVGNQEITFGYNLTRDKPEIVASEFCLEYAKDKETEKRFCKQIKNKL